MPKKKGAFKTRLEYGLFLFILFLAAATPSFARKVQIRILVFFLMHADRRHRRVLQSNLHLAFPAAGGTELKRLETAVYRHFVGILIEMAPIFLGRSPQRILSSARVSGIENLQHARAKGRGAIIFTAHFGNWEWIPLLLQPRLAAPIHGVARPMDNPHIEEKLKKFRERCGARVIYKQGSLRKILELLKKNETICMLIDVNTVPREGVAVDFFSRRAYAVSTVPQLCLKYAVPAVPVFVHYENRQIVLEIHPEVDIPAASDPGHGIQPLTQKLNAIIEQQIRRYPEQWFWFHDRWKSMPQGDEHASGTKSR